MSLECPDCCALGQLPLHPPVPSTVPVERKRGVGGLRPPLLSPSPDLPPGLQRSQHCLRDQSLVPIPLLQVLALARTSLISSGQAVVLLPQHTDVGFLCRVISMQVCVCVYVCVCVCVCVCVWACVRVFMCACACVCDISSKVEQ